MGKATKQKQNKNQCLQPAYIKEKKKKEQERKGGVLDKRDLGDISIERNA